MKIPLSDKPREAKPGFLKITEHYLCEEGEGSTLGALTYLVRLSGCNLRCWWCDSKQSSFFDDEEKMLPASQIAKAALKSRASWVSFTGGEPTWRTATEIKTLATLCARLRKRGLKIKIETNGLLKPASLLKVVDLWSVAPKWDASKSYASHRQARMDYDTQTLRSFPAGRLQLKFVITAASLEADLKRACEILADLGRQKKAPVFFIPEAYGKGDYLERCKSLASSVESLASKLKGWDLRVQPQWQRVLYGDQRGR